MGSTPLHRNVWASGTIDVSIDVSIDGGTAKGGNIDAGYIVACQLDFGGEASGGAAASAGWDAIQTGTVGNPIGTSDTAVGGGTLHRPRPGCQRPDPRRRVHRQLRSRGAHQ